MSVLKLSPSFAQKSEVLYKLAVIFGKTYQLDQAINYFKLAMIENNGVAGNNKKIDILIKIGICLIEKKEYAEALETFKNALSMNNQNFCVFQHIAWCEFLMEEYDFALDSINKAINFKETDSGGYYIKGRIFLETGKNAEAKAEFNKALSYSKAKAVHLVSLGIANVALKCSTEAFENFLKASQLEESVPEIWYDIGILYEIHQQYIEASSACVEPPLKYGPSVV